MAASSAMPSCWQCARALQEASSPTRPVWALRLWLMQLPPPRSL
ncbi:hypothetical protein EVA_12955 [gut metagenome]|uniref:Uncharacterized protein n=1 Tax=gut metagenome TaxID=749906 RepID=J9GHL0_9ZZZZ